MRKKRYEVTLSADAIVSATFRVFADSPEEARTLALQQKEENLKWEVDSLHDQMSACGTIVYLNGEEVKAEGF